MHFRSTALDQREWPASPRLPGHAWVSKLPRIEISRASRVRKRAIEPIAAEGRSVVNRLFVKYLGRSWSPTQPTIGPKRTHGMRHADLGWIHFSEPVPRKSDQITPVEHLAESDESEDYRMSTIEARDSAPGCRTQRHMMIHVALILALMRSQRTDPIQSQRRSRGIRYFPACGKNGLRLDYLRYDVRRSSVRQGDRNHVQAMGDGLWSA